ncbi:MAG: protein kinase [Candidatus Obscuribacterales bacterium]|nr:protein kinase [Candidatus Obscuribacterales bacterium]
MSPKTPHTPHDFASQDKTAGLHGHSAYDAPIILAPGKIILDRFVVVEHLGTGGMGSVFKVKHLVLDTYYALKYLHHKRGNDAIWRRFENEARAANRLDHPNLIRVHDSGLLPDGQPYFVMDLVNGSTLAQELTSRGTISLKQALKIFIQVGFALSYAHTNGVIHRDIKPSNIMIVKNVSGSLGGTVKVVDFGIAKLTGKDEYNQQTLTRTGEIFGSPLYMSPEQCMGIAVDHRSDLYSLGCVMYEALTGAPPMVGDSALSTMMKHQSEAPLALRQASMGLEYPESIEYVVAKLLEKDPAKRYQSANLLTADLVAIEQGQSFSEQNSLDTRQTLVAIEHSVSPAKKHDHHIITIIWTIAMLVLGFFLGHLTKGGSPLSKDEQEKKLAAQVQRSEFEKLPNFEPEKNGLSNLDSTPFSTLYNGGSKRIFHFPTSEPLGSICDSSWRGTTAKLGGIATGVKAFENFQPLYINFDQRISGSPVVFSKFRSDEIGGIKIYNIQNNLPQILRPIENYTKLEYLGLESSAFNKQNIPQIGKLVSLKHLNLKGTNITGQDLAALPRLCQLEFLNCSYIREITAVLQRLKTSKALNSLSTSNCNLSSGDIKLISQLHTLTDLDLTNNQRINDDAILKIAALKNLNFLDLEDCPVTPKSIQALKSIPALTGVRLSKRGRSAEEIQLWEKEFAPRKIYWKGNDIDLE